MKKVAGIILALMLCAACFAAVAELGSDFTKDEVTISLPGVTGVEKGEISEEARAASGADTVVKENGIYAIQTASGMVIGFDPRGTAFMTLTQSYYASYDVYGLFKDSSSAQNFISGMIADDTHIVVWDTYDAFNCIYMDTLGADQLTGHVGNLANLSSSDVNAVAAALADSLGMNGYELYSFNGNVWIQLGAQDLITIANGEYAHVKFIPNGDSMIADDYSDFTDFMRSLVIL